VTFGDNGSSGALTALIIVAILFWPTVAVLHILALRRVARELAKLRKAVDSKPGRLL